MRKTKKPAPKAAPAAKKPPAKPVAKAAVKQVPTKKPAPKAPAKPTPKAASKKPAKPVAKAPVKAPVKAASKPAPVAKKPAKVTPKPIAKPIAKAPTKPEPAKKLATPAPKPVAPAKTAMPVKNGKASTASAKPVAAPVKADTKSKKPVLDHDVAKEIITKHRHDHHQVAPTSKPKKKAGPIAFNLDDIEAYLKVRANHKLNLYIPGQEDTRVSGKAGKTPAKVEIAPVQNRQVTAVSVADLLGFNPFANKTGATHEEELIPQKYRKYYKLLIELRDHVNEGLATHTEEALKKTGKEDTGDVSAYSQHMADAGSDSFDRDFALSLVNNENEALYEISEAIDRMKDGTYGICEVTQKPIPHDRLVAVPFTRYSAEGQREMEKNRRRGRRAGGNPLLDMGDGISFGGASDEGEAAGEEA